MMDIVINTPTIEEELPISWQFRDGIIANIDKLAAEYLEEKNFKVRPFTTASINPKSCR